MTLTIDIHVLQSVPPANLNRDDAGSPKTAIYGGVRRARVSSQAWKMATRRALGSNVSPEKLGVRTKKAAELLAARITDLDPSVDATATALKALEHVGLKVVKPRSSKKQEEATASLTEYLVFFSNEQLDRLAQVAVDPEGGKSAAKEVMKSGNGVDLALFGRMVADDASLNVDASVQVAHALSTHAVATEFDFYTAVDDKSDDDETGAGMMGTIEFNSSTLYRYATINVDALARQLADPTDAVTAARAFVECFVTSMPSGKQNTFANNTLPEAVVVMVREGRAVSFVGAFEKAVTSEQDQGYVQPSCEQFARYATETAAAYATAPLATYVVRVGERTKALASLGEEVTFPELVARVGDTVRDHVGGAA